MNPAIQLHLPDELRSEAEKQASASGLSLEQFLVDLTARSLESEREIQAIRERARLARPDALERWLAAVPDVEPMESDRLPEGWNSPR